MRHRIVTALTTVLIAANAFAASYAFAPKDIQTAYETASSAMCILEYTMETRNPKTGEMQRVPGFASGIMVSPDGLIVSHGHLVMDDRSPDGTFVRIGEGDDEKTYSLKTLRKPNDINLSFFQITDELEKPLPYLPFSSEPELSLGASVLLFGVLPEPFDHAITSAVHRIGSVLEEPRTTFVLDESVSFGFVAGPVFDASGNAAGILGFDLSRGEGGDVYTRSGHPLVYQSSLFQKYIDEPPLEESSEDWGWLGVFTQPLTDDLANYWKLDPIGGVVVSTVVSGSPAAEAGILTGDVIQNFDGRAITAKTDQDVLTFTRGLRESKIGVPVNVELLRDGDPMSLEVTLVARPTAAGDAEQFEDTVLGLTVSELTTDARLFLNLPEGVEGVIVRSIRSGSPAQLAGIQPNYVILGIGRAQVRNISEYQQFTELMKEAKPEEVTFFCQAGANTAFFRVRPRWDGVR